MGVSKTFLLLKKLGVGIVAVAALLVVFECILILSGLEPIDLSDDPYIGFAKHSPVFVETQSAGMMQTAPDKLPWFNAQTFPKQKSPESYRVFCVGGSTTYGWPYADATSYSGWLRAFLKVADASKSWEIINVGGINYASYRVSELMEELAAYEPDLFVVYCGHDEFLEQRAYASQVTTPPRLLSKSSPFARTRSHALVQKFRQARNDQNPVLEVELPAEVDPLFEHGLGPQAYVRDDALRQQTVRHYELNLHRMVTIAHASGAEIILVSPAANIRDMAPFRSQDSAHLSSTERQAWAQALEEGWERLYQQDTLQALVQLTQAAALNPRHAETHYVLGQCLLRMGRPAEAIQALLRAWNEDVCPLRIVPEMQQALRRVSQHHSVTFLDFERHVGEACFAETGQRVPGRQYFFDHVHPRPALQRMLALELLEILAQKRVSGSSLALDREARARLTQRVVVGADVRAEGRALRHLARVMAWAENFTEAEMAAKQALELLGEDSELFYVLGLASMSKGLSSAAETYFRRATQVGDCSADVFNNLGSLLLARGDAKGAVEQFREALRVSPDRAYAHYNIGNVLSHQGEFEAASQAYERALALSSDNALILRKLAYVLAQQGRYDEAITHYRHVLKLDPHNARVTHNLHTAERMAGE